MTQDLQGLMDALGIAKADLSGWSMGGNEITAMAGKYPERVDRLVYLDGAYDWGDPEAPDIFLPIPGGWGKMGHTHIRLAAANEDVLTGALQTAWKLRSRKNAKTSRKRLA